MDDPKNNYFLVVLLIAGVGLSMVFRHFFGESAWRDIAILAVFSVVFVMLVRFRVVKKELVIRNTQTNELSYINLTDWEEILKNTKGKENIFEIIERF